MQKRIDRHLYLCRYIYAAFWISAAIFLIICMGRNIWPFGDRTILKVDLFHQYAPYIEEFRCRVLAGKSLVYSWETGMGKDFIAQTAYYAASPLNLLIFLFPEKMISEMIAFLIMLKISLCSASFTYYLREHFRRNDLSILIFGLLYLIEVVSVILQVGYFKLTHGRRLFKMAPIHHHFEKCGWSETRVVAAFTVFTIFMCLIAWIAK